MDHIGVENSGWKQSLFRRIEFVRQFGTTGKVEIPKSLRKQTEKPYLHAIKRKIEDNKIPHSLVLNLDQTLSIYVPNCNKTMVLKGAKLYR